MNISLDRETRIMGLGRTQEDAVKAMHFYLERSGRVTTQRERRRQELHAWLPTKNLLHVKDVGAILYEDNFFTNLRTGRKVRVRVQPLSHYLSLYCAFDGYISFEDFTLTIGPVVDRFLYGISDKFMKIDDFPYVCPVESLDLKYYHETRVPGLSLLETRNNTIVASKDSERWEVEKLCGVDTSCLISYLLAYMGYSYDGMEIRSLHEK